ncbi:MAG: GNAT family N-acetyltransferase [Roseobacter sp. MedPE-SW]|nr:MAG: GNAT family N-acetyltransferase [Roseobacter sp. MedPE-SW]
MTSSVRCRVRPANALDAGRTGWILYRFAQDTPWMPVLHSEAETISFCGVMIDRGWVTVAEQEGRVVGFLARDGAEICSLYLAPGSCGQGIGKALLQEAKAAQPQLWLQAFVANSGARRFYQREGFHQGARGAGQDNEEGLPDIRFDWMGDAKKEAQG